MEWTAQELSASLPGASTDQVPPPTSINWARERKQLVDDFSAQRISAAEFVSLNEQLIENERLERDDQRRMARSASTAEETRCPVGLLRVRGSGQG